MLQCTEEQWHAEGGKEDPCQGAWEANIEQAIVQQVEQGDQDASVFQKVKVCSVLPNRTIER